MVAGISHLGALGILIGCALSVSSPNASAHEDVRALAREKAAAVAILKHKAARQVATLVNDRIFVAYLNATTQGEGARIRVRMTAMLEALVDRFGVREASLVDRSGALIVHAGKGGVAGATIAKTAFARQDSGARTTTTRDGVAHAAAVVWRDQQEFVLDIRQSLDVYRTALTRGIASGRFAVLLDEKGAVLADTRAGSEGARGRPVAGLTLDGLRNAVEGTHEEGAGEVARGGERYKIAYEAVDSWTVLAVEPVPAIGCAKGAKPPCG
jgi:hypothetical protein